MLNEFGLFSPSLAVPTSILIGCLTLYLLAYSNRHKTPPGPRPLPLIRNAHQLPTRHPWLVFSEWAKVYGDLMYLRALGKSFIVISSAKIAKDLLDKRSSIYSDRPHLPMASLCGYEESFIMKPYGDEWRTQRRLVQNDFSLSMTPRYYSLQDAQAAILVRNVVKAPSTLESEVKLRIGGIILRVASGYKVESIDDPLIKTALTALVNFNKASTPGKFLVDVIPALQYLPRWLPGTGFLKTADEWRQISFDAAERPYEWCKENLATGKTLTPNLCARIIEETGENMSKEDEHALIWASASILGGGMDTNMSSALTFFRAMVLYPHVAKKAQAELDEVVGRDRLPQIADRPNLPYTRSIMAEVFRFAPAISLGIPHALTQDDMYKGYHLPKGAVILPNGWHMLHDPEVYPHPDEFDPDRFGGSEFEMTKVNDLTFGFGRRVCPGMHFAEGTLFAIIVTTLATCHILPGLDEDGKEVMPTRGYITGTITFPEPYSARLKPRSEQAAMLLAEVSSTME